MSLVGKNVGNYRVVAKIGEGGMGSVYLGEHPMIGKRVAIKTLHGELAQKEDIVARFFTEAKAVNDIGHPNIVDIVDFGKMPDADTGQDIVYFVMEFLDGEGLNSRLKREGVSPRECIHIMKQCASALSASHKKGIVHRDLKPENIYLVQRGGDKNYVKLLDFGIAKLTGGGEGGVSQHKTRTGLVIGTPSYMSPEQCEGKGNIDHRSDVYSLGVVMYEMLTGRVPFPGDGFGEILVAHLTKMPDLPSTIRNDVPPSLEAIVMHAMEKDKNARFQTMDEFLAALDEPGAHLEAYGSPSGRQDTTAAGTMMMDAPIPGERRPTGSVARVTGQGARVTGQGQRPTTLSGASGEMAEGAPVGGGGGASKGLIFAAAALVVLGVAGGVFFLKGRHSSAEQPAAGPVAPKAPETIKITLHSTPEGAKIIRAGQAEPIGVTPFKFELKSNEPDFDVLLQLDGYKDETRTVNADRDHDMLVALDKIEAPAVPSAPAVDDTPPTPSAGDKKRRDKSRGSRRAGGGPDRDDVMEPTF